MTARSRLRLLAAVLAIAAGTAATLWAMRLSAPRSGEVRPLWTEAAWPFPIDQWGRGKAFHCNAADCGTDIDVFLRAKIGFCNCTTGVADDQELERVADFDLFGDRSTAMADGRPIEVRWMKGRSRPYSFANAPMRGKSTWTIAFNDRCDVIVATAVARNGRPDTEPMTLEFLNGDTVIHWAEVTLGL